jgi:hypothetical protein
MQNLNVSGHLAEPRAAAARAYQGYIDPVMFSLTLVVALDRMMIHYAAR